MTKTEILALDGRDGDAAIALHVMGMAPMRDEWDNLLYWVGDGEPTGNLDDDGYAVVPHFFTDLNAARLVLAEIERRGKIKPFCDALWDMRNMDASLSVVDEMWACLTPTPAQLCHAALLAVEGV